MKDSGFRELADQICALARVETSTAARDVADLEISGIRFILMDGRAVEEGSMIFLCDFGEVPEAHRMEVLQRLLEANLVMLGVGTPCFSINYETNHVLLMGRVIIEKTPAKVLFKAFVQHARQAKRWRKTRFLAAHEPGAPRSERRKRAPRLAPAARSAGDEA
ncbi:MAG: hypothetical protein V7642_4645 [Burkholderiales bacterium]|jgi:hypothetical protein